MGPRRGLRPVADAGASTGVRAPVEQGPGRTRRSLEPDPRRRPGADVYERENALYGGSKPHLGTKSGAGGTTLRRMSASHLVRVLVCAGASLTLSAALGCSAVSNVDQTPCTDIDDCRTGFGLGWTCNEGSGFCEEVELNSLCTPYPEDLLTNADKYPGDTILFATLLDGVGDAQMVNSANLAVNQVNTVDGGKLEGRAFGMINCTYGDDSNTDEQISKAREASRYAVDAFGVQAIIGPGTSSLALEVWEEVQDEVLIVSPSATSDTLTYIDGTMKGPQNPGLFWRSAPPDSGIARKMAEILVNDGHDKLGFIYKNTAYGQNLADLFNKSLTELAPGSVERA